MNKNTKVAAATHMFSQDKILLLLLAFVLLIAVPFGAQNAMAATCKKRSTTEKSKVVQSKQKSTYKAPIETALLVDSESGKILTAHNANTQIHPASLTKIMTLYLAFEAIEDKKLSLHDEINVSHNAAKMKPCKLWLQPGEKIKLKDAILGMIIKSANDASVAVAEAVAGSEQKFVEKMNAKAKELGMHNTKFMNATGWHHRDQKTTATDLVKLAIAVKRDFPKHYASFSETSFKFRGHVITSHNKVVSTYHGAEGMKTGFTAPSGFNLVTVATRNGKTLVGVITGSKLAAERDKKMIAMMNKYFGARKVNVATSGNSNKERRAA